MAIAQSGALPEMPVTQMPLDDVNAALDALRAGQIRGRAILLP